MRFPDIILIHGEQQAMRTNQLRSGNRFAVKGQIVTSQESHVDTAHNNSQRNITQLFIIWSFVLR